MKVSVTILMALLFSTTVNASLSSRVAKLEEDMSVVKQKLQSMNSTTYVGGPLVELDKFLKQHNLSLDVGAAVTAEQIQNYHAILQACFDQIKKDRPDENFLFTTVELYHSKDSIGYITDVTNDKLQLFGLSTAQSCYNSIYSEGLKK